MLVLVAAHIGEGTHQAYRGIPLIAILNVHAADIFKVFNVTLRITHRNGLIIRQSRAACQRCRNPYRQSYFFHFP